MPGRSFNRNAYRYGSVNGQENDDEIFVGASTAMYWEYDSRLGRRWNIDPEYKLFPHESPYACFHNNPNFYSDPLGNKPGNPDKEAKKFGKKVDIKMTNEFQKKRLNGIDEIEKLLNEISPLVSNAKNETIELYSGNAGSYDITQPIEIVLSYLKEVKQLLTEK